MWQIENICNRLLTHEKYQRVSFWSLFVLAIQTLMSSVGGPSR